MNSIELQFGDVREKNIVTPNQFVSHMIEHVAWRLGVKIQLVWTNSDWQALGIALGKGIAKFSPNNKQAAAFGMIDDGSAEIEMVLGGKDFKLISEKNVNLKWFLSSRCEQLETGRPLVTLLEGLSEGLNAKITVNICSFEDPHHTWEAVFRGVGIALNKIYTPSIAVKPVRGGILNKAVISRATAETQIRIGIDFASKRKNRISVDVDKSINVKGLNKLLEIMTSRAGICLTIDFKARVLNSSHVVWEDIGLVMGRALLQVLKSRMKEIGINGAGSNLGTAEDIRKKVVAVGISVEGRKFCRIFSGLDYQVIRKQLLIGKNIFGDLRSEDLDDFLDGLSGGMGCSLLVNVKKMPTPEKFWTEVFMGTGEAIKEAFQPNPYRKGVPPGVKANLN